MERFRIVATILWVSLQIFWLYLDQLIRDGDEEGHVGAAELVKEQIENNGWISFITTTWWQDLGEYPPLYASYLGGWWNLFANQPEDLMFRIAGIPLLLCAAWATSEISRIRGGSYQIAFALTLSLPLAVGLSRHSMIENLILPTTALAAWSLYTNTKTYVKGIIFGLFVALGLLSKQTFLIAGLGLIFLVRDFKILYSCIPVILLVSLGWYIPQFGDQQQYIQQSIQANSLSSILVHLFSPIVYFAWDVIGPVIFSLFLLKKPWTNHQKPYFWWFLLCIFLCILIPKKYPRLMIGICIPIIIMVTERRGKWDHPIMIGAFSWMLFGSFSSIPNNPIQSYVDSERCPQVWLRPPFSYDLGLRRVKEYVQSQSKERNIYIQNPPKIPCSLQTTHDFPYHLEIYLRRHGQEHPIVLEKPSSNEIHMYWSGPIANPQSLNIQ